MLDAIDALASSLAAVRVSSAEADAVGGVVASPMAYCSRQIVLVDPLHTSDGGRHYDTVAALIRVDAAHIELVRTHVELAAAAEEPATVFARMATRIVEWSAETLRGSTSVFVLGGARPTAADDLVHLLRRELGAICQCVVVREQSWMRHVAGDRRFQHWVTASDRWSIGLDDVPRSAMPSIAAAALAIRETLDGDYTTCVRE